MIQSSVLTVHQSPLSKQLLQNIFEREFRINSITKTPSLFHIKKKSSHRRNCTPNLRSQRKSSWDFGFIIYCVERICNCLAVKRYVHNKNVIKCMTLRVGWKNRKKEKKHFVFHFQIISIDLIDREALRLSFNWMYWSILFVDKNSVHLTKKKWRTRCNILFHKGNLAKKKLERQKKEKLFQSKEEKWIKKHRNHYVIDENENTSDFSNSNNYKKRGTKKPKIN